MRIRMHGNTVLEEELILAGDLVPEQFNQFQHDLPAEWIEEALYATGTATVRRRRLPAEQVVWLVIGMAMMRDRPIVDVVDKLDLALPKNGKRGPVARSAVTQARAKLGDEPLEWLSLRSAGTWAHQSADRHRWRSLALYGVDGTTLRIPDSDENRAHFGRCSTVRRRSAAKPPKAFGRRCGASFSPTT
jgi:hypothetical protein